MEILFGIAIGAALISLARMIDNTLEKHRRIARRLEMGGS